MTAVAEFLSLFTILMLNKNKDTELCKDTKIKMILAKWILPIISFSFMIMDLWMDVLLFKNIKSLQANRCGR